jgi:hypothetical protein
MGKPAKQSDRTDDINSLIEIEVKRQLSSIRALVIAFSAGLGILVIAGLSFKEIFLIPLMRHIYPPQKIWEEVLSGDQKNLSAIPSQPAFYTSLEAKFDNELTNAFGIPGSVFAGCLNANEELRTKIMRMGGEIQRVDLRIVSKALDGDTTSCGRKFHHDKLHAIIRIPENVSPEKYGWLRCGGISSPTYKIEINANDMKLGGITIVAIERNGTTDSLELKVSHKVAQQLNLPDWRTYKTRTIGSYKLTDVFWE